MSRFVHKCMIKERGRGVVIGLKLPPKHIDVLRNINKRLFDSRIQGLNRYLRILVKRPDLLEMDCVQNFLKSDPVSFGNCCD
ncbi:hypothetical protein JH06_2347 [Blastocystis sp. subtype 4]|uniref:hypothetical protein n=1 Tax=Blastocystis sp. subtype 4 TaxID=944170 RepID=UPI0007115B63|nr:hypothetical protein JH06_2347 [Blastocystis sp. subtype 4]KNB46661.1 hypothetical protein JH06_2347 [Blastocystis sp. subtype 4]|eukprot:XP_014530132.1 hypothetical protein JH06_2347 [Blastocystis sp. subtype 4]